MQIPREGTVLSIFIGEADRYRGKSLYEWIVLQARAHVLAGATVLGGIRGGGASTRQNDAFRFDTLSEDLPIIAEVVDAPETLDQFLAAIGPYVKAGLATPETAQIKLYRFEP